jgi:tetratricopeptide (TPR) repeat protein
MNKSIRWWRYVLPAALAVGLLGSCSKSGEPKLDPLQEKAQEHYLSGRRLFLTCNPHNYPLAAREFEQALALWDEYPEAQAALAETYSMWRGFYLTDEDYKQAEKFAQRSIRLNPKLSAGYRALADLLRHRKDSEGALSQIDTAIQLDPRDAENYYVKGSILISTKLPEARDNLMQAMKLNPDLAKTYFNLGTVLQQLKDYERAEKTLLDYQKMVPDDVAGYTSLGMLYYEMGRLDNAKAQFEKVITKSGQDPQEQVWQYKAYLTLGEIAAKNKDQYDQALSYFDQAIKIFDESADAHYERGLIFMKKGDKKQARQALEKAVQFKPDFPEAKDALAKLK